jgi:alkanesulfonate monooxygenase SsuD/methylene tetrahydromethanopterin reductase-like flavin-dependent oxidoreductase (luciferase family)
VDPSEQPGALLLGEPLETWSVQLDHRPRGAHAAAQRARGQPGRQVLLDAVDQPELARADGDAGLDPAGEFAANRAEYGFERRATLGQPLGRPANAEGPGPLRGAIGTPEQLADLIRRYEAAGVDQMIFAAQAGPNQHEHVCEAIELFARKVMPEFHDRHEAVEERKRRRLEDAIGDALERRAPARKSPPGYVVPPAMRT